MTRYRATLAVAAAVTVGLGVSACGGSSGSGGGSGDESLSFQISEPKSLVPQENPGSQVAMASCANLMEMNTKTQKYEPLAARSVKSDDAKHWTIKLRKGWTFQDSSPVTAKSFVKAWNKAAYGPMAWQGNGTFASIKGYDALNPSDGSKPSTKKLSGVTTPNKHTIKVTLTEPNSDFPKMLSTNPMCPLPKTAFKDPKAYEENPISNGPYKFVSWDHNQSVVLKRWDGFKGDSGFSGEVKKLVAKIYTSVDSAYTDLTADNLDMIRNVPSPMVTKAKKQLGKKALYKVKTESKQYTLQFPEYLKNLRSPELRHAIAMSIDRKAIAKSLLDGNAKPSDSLVPPALDSYRKDSCSACTVDKAKAKKLLAKADGFNGTLTIDYNSDSAKQLVQAVAKQIRSNLGIKVKLKPMLATQLQSKRNSGKLTGALFGLWGWSYKSPDQYLSQYETNGDGNAATGYSNPEVDKVLQSARGEQDTKKRADLYAKAEKRILRDMPAVPLFVPIDYGLHSKCADMNDVQGDLQFYRAGISC